MFLKTLGEAGAKTAEGVNDSVQKVRDDGSKERCHVDLVVGATLDLCAVQAARLKGRSNRLTPGGSTPSSCPKKIQYQPLVNFFSSIFPRIFHPLPSRKP